MGLTIEEWRLIVAALMVCTPTGGGSPQLALAQKICAEHGIMPDERQIFKLAQDVINDYQDQAEG